jgi:hypothetical protein
MIFPIYFKQLSHITGNYSFFFFFGWMQLIKKKKSKKKKNKNCYIFSIAHRPQDFFVTFNGANLKK